MANSILIIDDDTDLLGSLGRAFQRAGWDVYRELSGEAGLQCHASVMPEVVLLDLDLPEMVELELFNQLRQDDSAVIVLAGEDRVATAVKAMSLGAENFLVKPVDVEHLVKASERAAEKTRLRRVNRVLARSCTDGEDSDTEFFGDATAMEQVRDQIDMVAASEHSAIAITGEIGVGKATVAKLLHQRSPQRDQPLLECVAATTDPHDLEVRLFGVEGPRDGSTAGSRQGLVELADRGMLLVGEITRMPLPIQARLGAVLDRQKVRRVDGAAELTVAIRLIVTTCLEPEVAVEEGVLEPTLHSRLKASRIEVPPLRELSPSYLAAFMRRVLAGVAVGLAGAPTRISDQALERLLAHQWPGNRLEARNVLQRAALLARGKDEIGLGQLPGELRARPGPFDRRHTPMTMAEVERMHIERTLRYHQGNRSRASVELGISRATLVKKIKRYAIPL